MTKYWSCSTLAFYDDQLIDVSQMPEDKVVVSEEEYQNLMSQQANGCVIVAGSDGSPEAMQQTCEQCDCLVHEKAVASSNKLGHVKTGGNVAVADDGTMSVDLSPFQLKSNIEQSLSQAIDKYPSSKAVSNAVNEKQNNIIGAASTITNDNLVSSRALVSDENGKVAVSGVTNEELGHLSGAKSNLQNQIENVLPAQSEQSGKFLMTDGENASWETVDALPAQSGQSGKFLKTDGTNASWEDVTQPTITYWEGN